MFLQLLAVFLLSALQFIDGRPTGAPSGACSTITPGHGGSSQTIPGGFFIYSDLVDAGGSYTASQSYTSKLDPFIYIYILYIYIYILYNYNYYIIYCIWFKTCFLCKFYCFISYELSSSTLTHTHTYKTYIHTLCNYYYYCIKQFDFKVMKTSRDSWYKLALLEPQHLLVHFHLYLLGQKL